MLDLSNKWASEPLTPDEIAARRVAVDCAIERYLQTLLEIDLNYFLENMAAQSARGR